MHFCQALFQTTVILLFLSLCFCFCCCCRCCRIIVSLNCPLTGNVFMWKCVTFMYSYIGTGRGTYLLFTLFHFSLLYLFFSTVFAFVSPTTPPLPNDVQCVLIQTVLIHPYRSNESLHSRYYSAHTGHSSIKPTVISTELRIYIASSSGTLRQR